jgi:small subunit ribosomal protein S6
MTEENKTYQLTYLLSPLLEQKKLEEISQKIKKWIIEKGGSFSEKENLSTGFKKNLAYPLKKYRQAFYFNLNFLLASQLINQLSEQLNLEKDILRHFIITKQKIKSKPIQEAIDHKIVDRIEPLVAKEIPLSKKSTQEKTPPEKKEKVKIEELDKKLEEILNE